MASALPSRLTGRNGISTSPCRTTASTGRARRSPETLRQNYWRQAKAAGVLAAYHALSAFSETDFRDDLKKITVPALVVHGSDDQIVPLEILREVNRQAYPAGQTRRLRWQDRHGLLHIDKDRLNADLLAFLRT